ncbi:MAG: lipid-A-disaccharide synthase N-terminal domain-containing protein [Rhodobacteraceae bacterium]|uniref:lipid-A-disaccharide synthase N-terminal domain-containing protein n=1 Tax=Amaricoccus sp. B4 TaxID=3368557 RepID=UPI000DACDAB3|nr:lipid-A-disaccharide synthase N-terminal domain-containing protein [Paracoccaceae bacterium]
MSFERVLEFLHVNSLTELWWVVVGLAGQLMFSMRFIVQWISSERARKSVMPVAFWYFSIAGGLILLSYAIYRKDPVFILGQATGLFIYLRNLYLIYAEKRAA